MALTPEQLKFYNGALDKLRQAIEGTPDFEAGPVKNPLAPCLIRGAIYDIISFNHSLGN